MAEYKLANGYVLTDEEIEARAKEWEDGTWKGQLVELRAGRPRLSNEPNANLSFKSTFMREAALEKAARVLSTAG